MASVLQTPPPVAAASSVAAASRTSWGDRLGLSGAVWGVRILSLVAIAVLAIGAVLLLPSAPVTAAGAAGAAVGLALHAWAALRAAPARGIEALLRDAHDATVAAHVVALPDGRIVHANATAARVLGRSEVTSLAALEEAFGTSPEARVALQRLREEAGGGGRAAIELPRLRPDGQSEQWLVAVRPLEGWPGHALWRIEDVTARHQAEVALREGKTKLVDFLDHAPVGFYSVDQDGRFLFANATLADWLEVAAADLVHGPHRLHDFVERAPANLPPYALTDSEGEDLTVVEVQMKSRLGHRFGAAITQAVVRVGDAVHTRSVVRDLTAETTMRAALRASEVRFRRFFDDSPTGVALLDANGLLTEWNRAFEALARRSATGLTGVPLVDLIAEGDRATVRRRLRRILETGADEPPIEARLAGATETVVLLYARRLDDPGGGQDGLLLQFIDRTEQRRLETQFTQSQKMQAVGQLAGGIAHDFNNLLTAMVGFCDLLLLRHKPGDPSFGDIMQIKQNGNRAANLIRQLLAFSRQQTLQPRILAVTDVLAELSNLLRRLIGENIELKLVHGRDLGLVKVDQGQLEQVIINLAVNARDAMPTGGRLTIQTSNVSTTEPMQRATEEMPPGDYVALEVIDTGTGIPAEILDRIFDPFFSTKEVGAGTGLGLSTVYGIVRQTGGYVFVDSAPDKGAKFTIYLPRHQREAAQPVVETGAAEPAGRDLTGVGSILLVEDEDPVRVFGARALRNKGYEVLEASSGDEALALLGDGRSAVDLLITDVVMPKMDGPTLIRRVRELRPGLKVICISGYAEDRFQSQLGDGVDIHFLAKPFSLKQLAGAVKDVLQG